MLALAGIGQQNDSKSDPNSSTQNRTRGKLSRLNTTSADVRHRASPNSNVVPFRERCTMDHLAPRQCIRQNAPLQFFLYELSFGLK